MTKLVSVYARSMGLQIDPKGPDVKEIFYPVAHERFITLQTGAGLGSKTYDLWGEVLRLLSPILDANKIAILHLGAKDDPAVAGVHDLRGRTTFLQSNYLIGKTLLHLGGDSWLAHCAGWHHKPLVALYGPTDPSAHGPYWSDVSRTSLLVSHRGGGRPTFANEQPKTLNLLPPEQIANEVLRLLGIQHVFTHQTRWWGILFPHTILDLLPDSVPHPQFLPHMVINMRMDLLHDEEVLAATLGTGRRINLVVSQPIKRMELLSRHRGQILSFNQELVPNGRAEGDHLPSLDYITTVKTLFPQHAFFTRENDPAILSALRFRYLDSCLIEHTKDTDQTDYLNGALGYTNKGDTPQNRLELASEASYRGVDGSGLWFRSNKAILSQGQAFPSLAHVAAKAPIKAIGEAARAIDDPLWYQDISHYHIYYQPPTDDSDRPRNTPSPSQSASPLQA